MLTVQALIWQCHHFSVLGKILEANGTSYNCRQILVHANPYRSYMSQAMSSRESQATPITSFHKWAKEAKIWKALNFGQQQFTRSRNLSLVSIVSINIEHLTNRVLHGQNCENIAGPNTFGCSQMAFWKLNFVPLHLWLKTLCTSVALLDVASLRSDSTISNISQNTHH